MRWSPAYPKSFPLTTSQELPEAKGNLKSTLTRLDKFEVEVSPGADEEERKRQKVQFECVSWIYCEYTPHLRLRALEVIKDSPQQISERSSAVGCQGNDTVTRAVCKLADDVRGTVRKYQVSFNLPITPGYLVKPPHSFFNKRPCTSRTVD